MPPNFEGTAPLFCFPPEKFSHSCSQFSGRTVNMFLPTNALSRRYCPLWEPLELSLYSWLSKISKWCVWEWVSFHPLGWNYTGLPNLKSLRSSGSWNFLLFKNLLFLPRSLKYFLFFFLLFCQEYYCFELVISLPLNSFPVSLPFCLTKGSFQLCLYFCWISSHHIFNSQEPSYSLNIPFDCLLFMFYGCKKDTFFKVIFWALCCLFPLLLFCCFHFRISFYRFSLSV